ncbi:MAG TPA: hypothetical protein VIY47_00085 [Ignavibacteriaceae bacterium]
MNIKFSYLYRDGANYKQFNEIVFSNPSNLTVREIEMAIKEKLIDGQWFVAKDWELPDLHFKEYAWDSEIDHDWHEFNCTEETTEESTEIKSIKDFLNLIQDKKTE